MPEFKLCIANPKTGKCYSKVVKDEEATPFIGLNIGETIQGDVFGMPGYEFLITGGSDYCGFPMRRGILGVRKKILASGGVGFPRVKKGMKKRKTVCGHKIHERISQINLKILKEGKKKLEEIFPIKKEEEGKEKEKPEEPKEPKEKKEAKKEEKKEQKKDDVAKTTDEEKADKQKKEQK